MSGWWETRERGTRSVRGEHRNSTMFGLCVVVSNSLRERSMPGPAVTDVFPRPTVFLFDGNFGLCSHSRRRRRRSHGLATSRCVVLSATPDDRRPSSSCSLLEHPQPAFTPSRPTHP